MDQLRFVRRLVLGLSVLLMGVGGAWTAVKPVEAGSGEALTTQTTVVEASTTSPSTEADLQLVEAAFVPATSTEPALTTTVPTSTSTSSTSSSTTTTTKPKPTTTTTTTTTTKPTTTTTTTATVTIPSSSTTTTTTTPSGGWTQPPENVLSESQIRSLLAAAGFPPDAVDDGVEVIRCETVPDFNASSLHPNGKYAGLFQNALYFWDARSAKAGVAGLSPYDPAANIAVGFLLWNEKQTFSGHWPNCGAGR